MRLKGLKKEFFDNLTPYEKWKIETAIIVAIVEILIIIAWIVLH